MKKCLRRVLQEVSQKKALLSQAVTVPFMLLSLKIFQWNDNEVLGHHVHSSHSLTHPQPTSTPASSICGKYSVLTTWWTIFKLLYHIFFLDFFFGQTYLDTQILIIVLQLSAILGTVTCWKCLQSRSNRLYHIVYVFGGYTPQHYLSILTQCQNHLKMYVLECIPVIKQHVTVS